MKHQHYDDAFDFDSDEPLPSLSPRIEQMSRKWEDEADEHRSRQLHRRAALRRRIEDWREERSLRRQFDELHEE